MSKWRCAFCYDSFDENIDGFVIEEKETLQDIRICDLCYESLEE